MSSVPRRQRFKLDQVYLRILEVLQRQGRISNHKLAEAVALSASPVLERVRKLESSGIVRAYGADVDLSKVCSSVQVWADVSLECYSRQFRAFDNAVAEIPEIVECYKVTGSLDYMLRFVCVDTDAYFALTDNMMKRNLGIAKIETRVVIERSKQFSGYPIRTLAGEIAPTCLDLPSEPERTLSLVR